MEKWRSKGRSPLRADVDFPKNMKITRPASPVEKKKGRRWTFGNFLKRKPKSSRIIESSTQTTESMEALDNPIYSCPVIPQEPPKNTAPTATSGSQDSMTSREVPSPLSPSGTMDSSGRNGRKNRLKLRIQAKREKYKSNSSSDEEFPSNLSLLRIHSEDSLQSSRYDSFNQKRTRGARTERYMKRILTNGDQNGPKNHLKCPSDILPPTGSPLPTPRKSQSCTNSYFGSDSHIPSCPSRFPSTECHNNKYRQPYETNEFGNQVTPPEPPPRAFKLRLYPTTMRYSLQHSDIENNSNDIYTCNSLDRNISPYLSSKNISASPKSDVWRRRIEEPIVPQLQARQVLSKNVKNMEDDRRRHSKNLEEALEELETIYNSLRLSDEDLLDRAEERSMEEYRDKLAIAAVDGSIVTSDTSSSTEITREFAWRDAGEADARLKDDMAYRRMHQNERPSSVDNFGSISRISYLASSPCLSSRDAHSPRPRSRRGTPDLTRDDVVFRSLSRARNTLRVADPQPPFGIPLGPVSGAAESDYLHVVPQKDPTRSLYVPKREPDVVTDDLAFRSLRKDGGRDGSQSPGNVSFLPRTSFTPEVDRSKTARSLSADLYGIINKDSQQSCWYKKYVRLNRPLRVSGIREAGVRHDLDINGNKPKKGQLQVNIPQESEDNRKSVDPGLDEDKKDPEIPSFTDEEVSEYKELCRELENLIKKTSEKVKMAENVKMADKATPRNSLTEFVEWEELLNKTKSSKDDEPDSAGLQRNDSLMIDEAQAIEDVGEETNLPEEPVPYLSVSEATEPDELTSIAQLARDGGSGDEGMHEKIENNHCSSDTGNNENDKIQVTSKDNRLNNDGIDLASMIEGNKYNVELNGHLLKSIMNVCFVTNCLTAYTIALWSLCLTLLIAIIVAL